MELPEPGALSDRSVGVASVGSWKSVGPFGNLVELRRLCGTIAANTMILANDIRTKLQAVLDGEMHLDHFDDWLVMTSWNMRKDSTKEAQRLVGAIELAIFEYQSGNPYEDLLAQFRDILKRPKW